MVGARSDVVGSLLRAEGLAQARQAHTRGELSHAAFKAVEDAAVDACLQLQERCGLAVVTDGEQRRLSFQSQLAEAVAGFGDWGLDAFLWGRWHGDQVGDHTVARPDLAVTGRLERTRFLSGEEFTYVRGRTDRLVKVTLPSPSLFANFWDPRRPPAAYRRLEDFLADVTRLLAEEVDELARLGATYLQLDAPHYTMLLDPGYRQFYESRGVAADDWLAFSLELDNAVMTRNPQVTFAFHLCRGNQASRWLVAGGYERLAERVFPTVAATRLMLEYDDERSGGFAPLAAVPDDKEVVLGLVTTKSGRLEDRAALVARVHEAAAYVPLERLAVSTQCGFATSVVGNALSSAEQAAKLRLVADTARAVWGPEPGPAPSPPAHPSPTDG
ncbi:MAG: cobalamin-independent methionine synthase II family protein [Egibacteraceae bacterium]